MENPIIEQFKIQTLKDLAEGYLKKYINYDTDKGINDIAIEKLKQFQSELISFSYILM